MATTSMGKGGRGGSGDMSEETRGDGMTCQSQGTGRAGFDATVVHVLSGPEFNFDRW
jgi:hypothetical protein